MNATTPPLNANLPDPNSDPASILFILAGLILIWQAVMRIRNGEPIWQRYSRRPQRSTPWLPRRVPPLVQLWIGTCAIVSSIVLLVH
jgi:hypothetical protein